MTQLTAEDIQAVLLPLFPHVHVRLETEDDVEGSSGYPVLKKAIENVGDDGDNSTNYWDPTTNNVKKALHALLSLAQMRPDGVWQGD